MSLISKTIGALCATAALAGLVEAASFPDLYTDSGADLAALRCAINDMPAQVCPEILMTGDTVQVSLESSLVGHQYAPFSVLSKKKVFEVVQRQPLRLKILREGDLTVFSNDEKDSKRIVQKHFVLK